MKKRKYMEAGRKRETVTNAGREKKQKITQRKEESGLRNLKHSQ